MADLCDKYGWFCDYCTTSSLPACQDPAIVDFCNACSGSTKLADCAENGTCKAPESMTGTAHLSSRYFWVIDCQSDSCQAPGTPVGVFDTGSAGYIYEPASVAERCQTGAAPMHYQGTNSFQVCADAASYASHVMNEGITGAPHGAIFGVLQGMKGDATVRGRSLKFQQCHGDQHYTIETKPLPNASMAWSIGCAPKPTASPDMVCRPMPESSQHGLNVHSYHAWWPTTCAAGNTAVTLVDSGWPGYIQERAYKHSINVAASGTFLHHSTIVQFDDKQAGTICLSADLAANLDEHAEQAMCTSAGYAYR
jgi:hypothetical protein